jgi:pimeloyl-ACP methyl ester carboxylesterase
VYINGVPAQIIAEKIEYLDHEGKLITETLRDYSKKVIPVELVDAVLKEGLGEDVPPEERTFWHETYQKNYTGDAGRKRVRISSINLRDRDGLHGRLDSVRCPVLRMHGTADPVYSVANAEDEMKLFVNIPGPSSASSRAAGTS